MHARSALFDVYGDHLHRRGHQAPVAALVRLLEPVGIAGPAVRTAVSRMVTQGWLDPVRLERGRGYRATPRAVRRLGEAARRVYARPPDTWDGTWHMALVDLPASRSGRDRLRGDLGWLGYGPLSKRLWVAPSAREELAAAVERAGAGLVTWQANDLDPAAALAAWDLAALRASYDDWLARVDAELERDLAAGTDADEAAFAARFRLVHEWRKFLFTDPGLPEALLPADWPGRAARTRFAAHADRLEPGAGRFVARCLGEG